MKMDKNLDSNGGDSPPHQNNIDNTGRPNVSDALNDLLEQLTSRLSNPPEPATNGHTENRQPAESPQLSNNSQQASQIFPQVPNAIDLYAIEGIDPASPLGRSLQTKFSELEEISRRLKTRLNQVVHDTDILLDVDPNIADVDLERDLNTDSQAEDLTPQEFFQLVQSQIPSTSQTCVNQDTKETTSK